MIKPYRMKELQSAFKLNPVKLHNSTGLTLRECIFHFSGEKLGVASEFTLQNFYGELEDRIRQINRSLNLVQKRVI